MYKRARDYKRDLKVQHEKQEVLFFLMTFMTKTDEKHREFTADIYDAYKDWRALNGLAKTVLSIDGFSKLFPKIYVRKAVVTKARKGRAVVGFSCIWRDN